MTDKHRPSVVFIAFTLVESQSDAGMSTSPIANRDCHGTATLGAQRELPVNTHAGAGMMVVTNATKRYGG